MKAAIYARFSSDNQRVESLADKISSCRRYAESKGHVILVSRTLHQGR